MADFDVRAAVEVGDGAGHLQDTVVGTGGKAQTVHRLLQEQLPRLVNTAIFPHHPAAHLRVREHTLTPLEPPLLDFPRCHHPLADFRTALRRFVGGQFLVTDWDDLNMEVDANWDYMYQKSCLEKYT